MLGFTKRATTKSFGDRLIQNWLKKKQYILNLINVICLTGTKTSLFLVYCRTVGVLFLTFCHFTSCFICSITSLSGLFFCSHLFSFVIRKLVPDVETFSCVCTDQDFLCLAPCAFLLISAFHSFTWFCSLVAYLVCAALFLWLGIKDASL